jgi:hypothetical protein
MALHSLKSIKGSDRKSLLGEFLQMCKDEEAFYK